jgi:hypothetical protein
LPPVNPAVAEPARTFEGTSTVKEPLPGLEQVLLRDGAVDRAHLALARADQVVHGGWLGEHLMRRGALTAERICDAVARQLGVARADDGDVVAASRMLTRLVPREWAVTWHVVPFNMTEAGHLQVAFFEPQSLQVQDGLQRGLGTVVEMLAATEPAVEAAMARLYPAPPVTPAARPAAPQAALPSARVALGNLRSVPRAVTMPAVSLAVVGSNQIHLPGPAPAAPYAGVRQHTPRAITMPVMPMAGVPVRVIPRAVTIPQIPVTTIRPGFRRIGDVGQAAEEIFTAENLRTMAEVTVAFVCNFFPRVVVLDLSATPAPVLAQHGLNRVGVTHLELPRGVERPYYGVTPDGPAWPAFARALGPPPPAVMLIMPVFRGETARILLYADSPANELYEDLREVDTLVRELRTALQVLNL